MHFLLLWLFECTYGSLGGGASDESGPLFRTCAILTLTHNPNPKS